MVARVQLQGQSESRSEEHLDAPPTHHSGAHHLPAAVGRADRVSGTALVIHDLGYQRTLEESARRNESLARLGTLVAGLAHEMRNPLAGIKGAAQLLEARLARAADLGEYTAVISREVNRLAALVEDLLALGAPPKPRLAPLNIHRVIQHVVARGRPELRARRNSTTVRVRPEPARRPRPTTPSSARCFSTCSGTPSKR